MSAPPLENLFNRPLWKGMGEKAMRESFEKERAILARCSWNVPTGHILNLGGGFEYFLFSSLPGEMIQFD